MDRKRFLHITQDPGQISQQDLEGLEELVRNFPYCQNAYILLAKGNYDNGSMYTNQKIKQAALYAADRSVLKQITEQQTHITSDAKTENLDQVQEQVTYSKTYKETEKAGDYNNEHGNPGHKESRYDHQSKDQSQGSQYKAVNSEQQVFGSEQAETHDRQKSTIHNDSSRQPDDNTMKTETTNTQKPDLETRHGHHDLQVSSAHNALIQSVEENLRRYRELRQNIDLDDLFGDKQQENKTENKTKAYQDTTKAQEFHETTSQEEKQKETAHHDNNEGYHHEKTNEDSHLAEKTIMPANQETFSGIYGTSGFTANMQETVNEDYILEQYTGEAADTTETTFYQQSADTENTEKTAHEAGHKFYVHTKAFGRETRQAQSDVISDYLKYRNDKAYAQHDENSGIKKQDEVITNFLKNEPDIGPAKEIPDEPEAQEQDLSDFDEESLEEEVISENLAKIYIKQGKKEKAKKIYKQLSLKYPDKKTYFAEQIKSIE